MKKLFVMFVFASAAFLTSCSSDDDNGGGNEAKIIGKWEYSQVGTEVDGQEFLLPYENEAPECGKDFVEFLSNNTFQDSYFYLDFNDACTSDLEMGIYSISDNNITVSIDGEAAILEIVTLNNSTLKVKGTEEFEGETFVFITVFNKI